MVVVDELGATLAVLFVKVKASAVVHPFETNMCFVVGLTMVCTIGAVVEKLVVILFVTPLMWKPCAAKRAEQKRAKIVEMPKRCRMMIFLRK